MTAALKLVPEANYFDELCVAMALVAAQPKSIFMGQGVGNPGTTMSDTFRDVPAAQKLEMPVAEDMQMGMAIGMALGGHLPVCVFPRWNFLICAANQLVNHLDRLQLYSDGGYRPKVIIRTAVPSTSPFNPGPQHDDDFTFPFSKMLRSVNVVRLISPAMVVPAYREAIHAKDSTLLVEFTEYYKDARADARTS
jgi:pyruvate/2-oxoglutarate/acetoin dehydrogenase E1 component